MADGKRTHYKRLVDTTYLGQWDLQRPDGSFLEPVVIIESVDRYTPEVKRTKRLPDGRRIEEKSKRLAISFRGKKKPWLSGPVTQAVIANMYGPIIEDWIGKPIQLYVDSQVEMGGKVVGGIRVKSRAPRGPASEEPLDNAPDEAKQKAIDEAAGREPGEG